MLGLVLCVPVSVMLIVAGVAVVACTNGVDAALFHVCASVTVVAKVKKRKHLQNLFALYSN